MNRIGKVILIPAVLLVGLGLSAWSQQSVPAPAGLANAPGGSSPTGAGVPGAQPARTTAKQPVLILLNTRFYDHTHPQYAVERIAAVLPLLKQLRAKYPNSGISSVFQFSGSMSEVLAGMLDQQPEVRDVQRAVADGLIEVGYTGEDEPTYGNRPQANFILADTPEKRWLARTGAAEHFLRDFKDPITGDPFPGLVGGMERMQQVFGEASFASGLTQNVGDNGPILHQMRRMNKKAILSGFPDADPIRGITEYRLGIVNFGKIMGPEPATSPEVFWEDNVLHSSDTGGIDVRSMSTDEGPEALKAVFDGMDRSSIRVVHIELGSYLRYLRKGPDGKPVFPPLEWAYSHPQSPGMPNTLKFNLERTLVDASVKKEEAALRWLFEEFLPANPGSRFVSVADLKKMAKTSLDTDVSQQELKAAASDLLARYAGMLPTIPNFVHGQAEYFSLCDLFEMLSGALAESSRTGALPAAVKLRNVYGPLQVSSNPGINDGTFTFEEIAKVANEIHAGLIDQTWKPVPGNVIPPFLTVSGQQVNAAQFLLLMAEAYLDPVPQHTMKVERTFPISPLAGVYPRRVLLDDMGNSWTLKPAILQVPVPAGR